MDTNFGNLLRDWRTAAGLSQQDLADALGYSARSAISMMENGKRPAPDWGACRRIARRVNVDPDRVIRAAARDRVERDPNLLAYVEGLIDDKEAMSDAEAQLLRFLRVADRVTRGAPSLAAAIVEILSLNQFIRTMGPPDGVEAGQDHWRSSLLKLRAILRLDHRVQATLVVHLLSTVGLALEAAGLDIEEA